MLCGTKLPRTFLKQPEKHFLLTIAILSAAAASIKAILLAAVPALTSRKSIKLPKLRCLKPRLWVCSKCGQPRRFEYLSRFAGELRGIQLILCWNGWIWEVAGARELGKKWGGSWRQCTNTPPPSFWGEKTLILPCFGGFLVGTLIIRSAQRCKLII